MRTILIFLITVMNTISGTEIEISISEQRLYLIENDSIIEEYVISTSAYGEGSEEGSFKTPLGKHAVKKLIGDQVPYGGRLIGRIFNGEIYPIHDEEKIIVKDDVVQSRVIWLEGLELGKNKGTGVDSFQRYIYIHGTPEEWRLGSKASKGCIRMSNLDVISLFSKISLGTAVNITL